MEADIKNDPVGAIAEMAGKPSRVVEDADRPGYYRFIPSPEEREALEKRFAKELRDTINDYVPILKKREENHKAYEGISPQDAVITIPVCKRDTNQQHAWQTEALLSKEPYITVKPLEEGVFETVEGGNVAGISTEEWAKDLEDWLDFKLRHRLGFAKTVREWTMQAMMDGNCPALIKVYARDAEGVVRQRKASKGADGKLIIGVEGVKTLKGERVVIECIDGANFLMPVNEIDPQQSPWIAERLTNVDTTTLRKRFSTGEYNLCQEGSVSEEQIANFLGESAPEDTALGVIPDGRNEPTDPLKKHNVYELRFIHPVEREKGQIELIDFTAHFHLDKNALLCCYANEYWHSKRPYVPLFMRQRPNRFSGTCTVEDAAPFQRLQSTLFHLQVQNAIQSNVKVFLVRHGSRTHIYMQNNPKRRPGEYIPYDDPTDVSPQPLGSPIQSMASEISFLSAEAEKITMVNQYDRGAVPGRTASSAIAQTQELAKMQPAQVRRVIREALAEVALLYVQTASQFIQEEDIPWFDPVKRQRTQKTIRFPLQMIQGQVAFELTATDEDDDKAGAFETAMMISNKINEANNARGMLLGGLVAPETPPQIRRLFMRMLISEEQALAEVIKLHRKDWQKYVLTEEEIAQAVAELEQMAAAAQQQQMMQGGMSGDVPPEIAGGAVPPPQDLAGAMGQMEAIPGDGGGMPVG